MKSPVLLTLVILCLLSACGTSLPGQSSAGPSCGNGSCESGESRAACPQDCSANGFSGHIQTTIIKSEGAAAGSTIDIAVMVASPQSKRYSNGAGIVVVIPPLYAGSDGFTKDPDLASLGLIQVSFLWPGRQDSATKSQSEGAYDGGGPNSIKILRDVIRFAGGRLADTSGRYIFGLASVPPLTDELGLYAFGDAGLAGVKALSLYGDQFQGLQYYVAREITTCDALASHEAGYFDENGKPVLDPVYGYPSGYSFDKLNLNYTNLSWDPALTSSRSTAIGRPYLDLDGNGSISGSDFIFDGDVPSINGKRYYSIDLTQALSLNGSLSADAWPSDLATPQEARSYWQFLQNPERFPTMLSETIIKNLKVMLVFAQEDHSQVAADKPHIHQLYQGFRFEARLWVRLNPDRAYIQEMFQHYGSEADGTPVPTVTTAPALNFPDNPANTQPADWADINDYAYPGQGMADLLAPLAAVAEMADRAHSGYWDENIGQVIYHYSLATPTP